MISDIVSKPSAVDGHADKPLQDAGTVGIQWPLNLGAKVARFMTNREEGISALALASGKAWPATEYYTAYTVFQSEHRTPHRHIAMACSHAFFHLLGSGWPTGSA